MSEHAKTFRKGRSANIIFFLNDDCDILGRKGYDWMGERILGTWFINFKQPYVSWIIQHVQP